MKTINRDTQSQFEMDLLAYCPETHLSLSLSLRGFARRHLSLSLSLGSGDPGHLSLSLSLILRRLLARVRGKPVAARRCAARAIAA